MNITHYFRPVRTLALAAIAAATLAACTDNDDAPDGGDTPLTPGIPVAFTADITPGSDTPDATPASAQSPSCQGGVRGGSPSTRTVLTPDEQGGFTVTWRGKDNYPDNCDKIRIRATKETVTVPTTGRGKAYVPATSAASSALEPENDGEQLTLPSGGEWTFTAIYGYNAMMGTSLGVYIPSLEQSAPGNTEHIAAWDFSVATATRTVTAQSNLPQDISLKFEHKLSALQLHVTNQTDAPLTVREIRLSVDNGQITTKKYWDAAAGGWSATNEDKRDYQQLTIANPAELASGGTEAQDFHLLLFPGYGGERLTITVITDLGAYTLTKAAPTAGFAAGKNYMTNITVRNSRLSSDETWTEYIGTKDQLKAFRDKVNGGTTYEGKTVALSADIDLSGETWTPIGTNAHPFMGTFDGGGHHISNLNVNMAKDYAGLFGRVQDATLRNLRVSGNVTSTADYVGGIAGDATRGLVENCIFSGEVSGNSRVGGIAGSSSTKIAGCYTKGTITAADMTGGIAGVARNAVTDCYSEADVTAENAQAGGIAGTNNANGPITRCYATGAIRAKMYAGGIIGANYAAVTDCIALNPGITRTTGTSLTFGRIAGNSGSTVDKCAAWDGMTLTDDATSDPLTGATGTPGEDLATANALTTAPYTSHDFAAPGWAFDDQSSWQFLPWNKAFETIFPGIDPAAYRIAIPKHLKP